MTAYQYNKIRRFLGGEDNLRALLLEICAATDFDPTTALKAHIEKGLPLRDFFIDPTSAADSYSRRDAYAEITTEDDATFLGLGICFGGLAGKGISYRLTQSPDKTWHLATPHEFQCYLH